MTDTKETRLRPSKSADERAAGHNKGPEDGYYGIEPVKAATGTGGLKVIKASMQMPAKIPCRECPLRKDAAPGFLGGYTPEMYLDALFSPASLACHCSKGFHEGDIAKQRHCTGVAGFRANMNLRTGTSADRAIHAVIEGYPRNLREDFFENPTQFYNHHKPAQLAIERAGGMKRVAAIYPGDWGHDQEDSL